MFKKHMTPLTPGGQLVKHAGKGSSSQVLPSRHSMSDLTGGDQAQRSMNNYAKQTPMPTPPASDTGPMAQALGGVNPAMSLGGMGGGMGGGGMGKSGGI